MNRLIKNLKAAAFILLVTGAMANSALGQEKHALLVIGEGTLPAVKEQLAANILTSMGYTVHPLRPRSAGEVSAEIARLGAISQDQNQPDWNRFIFFFIGHGGGGLMALNDENGKESGTVFTDVIAKESFEEIWVDAYTFIFDMCEAFSAVDWVWRGASQSNEDPTGWILGASSRPDLGDGGSTYDELFTQAIKDCLSGMGQAVNADVLGDCLTQERWYSPWWYKSLPRVSKINLTQPDDVPVF